MILHLNKKIKEHVELRERIINFSLAHTVEYINREEPILMEGEKRFVGITSISKYLDELGSELHQWHYCNC